MSAKLIFDKSYVIYSETHQGNCGLGFFFLAQYCHIVDAYPCSLFSMATLFLPQIFITF